MKHFTIKLMTVAATLLAFASCSKDDDGPSGKIDLKVQAVAPTTEDKVPDYSQFTVTVSSERDGKTMTESLDASGSATFNLDIGSYGIEIRGKENGKEYFGTTGMTQYGQSTTVSVDVENLSVHYTGNMDGIVLSELFYNGGTYGGTMMHPDQYIVIANNSDREINVSGLALAQASNMNTLPCSDLTSLLPDYVVAANIYQIPAGQNYTLAPGEVYVIASQAQNHTESYTPNPEKDTGIPVDLSGADFELADNDAAMSGSAVDNPKVPNLTKIANSMPGGVTAWMHPYGIRPLFLFDASGIEWSSFKSQNGFTYNDRPKKDAAIQEYQGYKVPTNLIVDAIETTSATTPYWGNYTSKSLPVTVDKSYVQATIEGCHHNTFMYRVKGTDGKFQDTNDSSVDVKIEHRSDFKGYPEGWRNE